MKTSRDPKLPRAAGPAWFHFTISHRKRLCIYAGVSPDYGKTDFDELPGDVGRKIHNAFLQEFGVELKKAAP